MTKDELDKIVRTLEIAEQIHHCDFLVITSARSNTPDRIIICAGESSWSRCFMVDHLDSNDPIIQLLVDDGSDLCKMLISHPAIEKELPLSKLVAGTYGSVKKHLNPEDHRNQRLS